MKKNIAIITGGDSGEYEVSLKTANNIAQVLDNSKYALFLIHLKGQDWTYKASLTSIYHVDKSDFSLNLPNEHIYFDAVFIAIHGTPGENGKLQAYFDLLNIPYTGCDMLCSALTFNKYFCNIVVKSFGIAISPSVHYFKNQPIDNHEIEKICGYPCFVKPCNSGSSVGVTKVHHQEELQNAINKAFKYDNQLMVEKNVKGKEITCGVANIDGKVKTLTITEIRSKKEYYDYEAKYTDEYHELITPAKISQEIFDKILRDSEKIYRQLGCCGVARIDYIVTEENENYFLEINTIPGQTAMSIIPNQLRYCGINISDFYSQLIEEALRK
jgi:D-alanine-D-alanine ligase